MSAKDAWLTCEGQILPAPDPRLDHGRGRGGGSFKGRFHIDFTKKLPPSRRKRDKVISVNRLFLDEFRRGEERAVAAAITRVVQ